MQYGLNALHPKQILCNLKLYFFENFHVEPVLQISAGHFRDGHALHAARELFWQSPLRHRGQAKLGLLRNPYLPRTCAHLRPLPPRWQKISRKLILSTLFPNFRKHARKEMMYYTVDVINPP